jgi:hypothetical protein
MRCGGAARLPSILTYGGEDASLEVTRLERIAVPKLSDRIWWDGVEMTR